MKKRMIHKKLIASKPMLNEVGGAVRFKWIKKIPMFGKWWSQEAIVITDERTPHFVITKGARERRPFSLWRKCYDLDKTESFIGNFKTLEKAKKVARFINEG